MSDSIDWSNPKSKISKFFTVGEATYLPRLKEYYSPTEEEKQNIVSLALKLDKIRELVNDPIIVSIWVRPTNHMSNGAEIDYNKLIGGAKSSAHITGEAVDFVCKNLTVDRVLDIIQPKCSELEFTLENNGSEERIKNNNGTGGPRNWVHFSSRSLTKEPIWRMFNP
jgi:hypothetical protein